MLVPFWLGAFSCRGDVLRCVIPVDVLETEGTLFSAGLRLAHPSHIKGRT